MLHLLSSPLHDPSASRSRCESRVLLSLILLRAGSLAMAAEPPAKEKTDGKEASAHFRAYLPVIRLKAKLDSERQAVADLEEWLKRYDRWLEGGLITLIQRDQILDELLRGRIRVLKRDANYRDALDQLTSRFPIAEERRRKIEDAATASLTRLFQRFLDFSRDYEAAINGLLMTGGAKDIPKMRPVLVKILTESALVKNTALPKRFLKLWDEWKKIDDVQKLMEKILKRREDLNQLRRLKYELEAKQQKLSEADRQRFEDLEFEVDLGEFQSLLLSYEKQPWKDLDDVEERLKHRNEAFYETCRVFRTVLDYATIERQNRLEHSWPGLEPVKVKDMDLLACERGKAEAIVVSLLKSPDAQLAGKKKVRHIRMLAESYQTQQQLFHLAFIRSEQVKYAIAFPTFDRSGKSVRASIRPGITDPTDVPTLLEAIRTFSQIKQQLLQTWIDYQMVRLDLYGDLGWSPPER